VLAVTLAATATPAAADTIRDKQRQAQHLADEIDRLGDKAVALGDDYVDAQVQLEDANQQVAAAEQQVAELDQQLGGLRGKLAGFAVRAYVYADQNNGIAGLLSGQSLTQGVAQRSGYTAVAFGASLDTAGDVKVALQDMERARATVRLERDKADKLTKVLSQRREAVDQAIADQQRVLTSVKGELVELVRQERVRREQAAARAAQAALAAAQRAAATRRAVPVRAATPVPAKSGSGTPPGPRPGTNVPPPAAGAAAAVRFALSQLGVPYHYAMAVPGVGFDCSGLTMWAWGRAGVALPRSSRAQAAALPAVSLADIQPGDLIFSHNPVGHVGMYIGNGQMVHAPRSGEVVSISPITRQIVKIGRPG